MKTNIFIAIIASLMMTACPSGEQNNQVNNQVNQTNQASNVPAVDATPLPSLVVKTPAPLVTPKIEDNSAVPANNQPTNQPTNQPANQSNTKQQGGTSISLKSFDKIQNGMSYKQVVAIVGSPGEIMRSDMIGGAKTDLYKWNVKGSDNAYMDALFQGDKLIDKSQSGLK